MSFAKMVCHTLSGARLASIALTFVVSGCMFQIPVGTSEVSGGGDEVVLHMPIPSGKSSRCTQGAGGSYSHNANSTQHDIDLDTANDADEEIYAPIGGTAYVHIESATSGFGYHVNIDIGNGQYVVIGHFKEIFISDESEVATGQLIGYEGCTGNCTGDHIHLGLHEGDASEMAASGTSVSVSYKLTDSDSENAEETVLIGDDLVCGTTAGHVYTSSLPVTLWHPDGTLIKVPDDPKVYSLEDGERVWFENEQVFWSHNYDFDNMSLVSDEEADCYAGTASYNQETLIDAVMDGSESIWLLVGEDDDEDAYKIAVQDTAWEQVLMSWGLNYTQDTIPHDGGLSDSMLAHSTREGYAVFRDGTLVTEQSSSDVYVVTHGVAAPIKDWDTYLMLGFHDREILTVSDGVVEQIHDEVGNCSADLWCLDQQAITTCGGGFDLGSGGNSGGEEAEDNEDDDDEDEEDDE